MRLSLVMLGIFAAVVLIAPSVLAQGELDGYLPLVLVGVSTRPTGTASPTQTTTGTPPPTGTVEGTVTATGTTTAEPTETPATTPTATPTVACPVAPADAGFNEPLDIPLNSTLSVTEFVSISGGDAFDRSRYSVTGMNPISSLPGGRARLVIAVSCFGTGTNQNLTLPRKGIQ